MAEKLLQETYVNDRCPGRAKFSDKSKLKIGRQSLPNRLKIKLTGEGVKI